MTPWRRQPASRESGACSPRPVSSPGRLFERKGFAVVERQDLVIRGVAIHNYRMAKALDLTAPHLTWSRWRAISLIMAHLTMASWVSPAMWRLRCRWPAGSSGAKGTR